MPDGTKVVQINDDEWCEVTAEEEIRTSQTSNPASPSSNHDCHRRTAFRIQTGNIDPTRVAAILERAADTLELAAQRFEAALEA